MSRRDQIVMTDEEVADFLAASRTVTCATIARDGRPHLMPLWYVRDGDELRGWTFAKSQKAKNIERDPHATLQVEAGVDYQELRGVMMECDVVTERDPDKVAEFGLALFERYAGGGPEIEAMVHAQAPKRVGLTFTPTRTVSYDHRKLGGTY